MNYSLGNMLGGAGALNPDKLALNLQFATDKTLTARKGPTPVFTRASSATQVGATGLIEFAPENTLLRSEEFDAASWDQAGARNLTVAANNIASPTGSMTADKLTVGATTTTYNVIQLTPTFISGSTYTVSCYFKANEVTRVSIWATTTATFGVDAFFDLTGSGSVTANAFGTASIQALSNGWYRCIITGTSTNTAATTLRIGPATTGNSRTYVGNSTDSFYVWGAQLEQYSTARTYIPTTTAVVYGARFDHDPITLACKGLLIEESRTNLALQSENHASATWSKTGVTVASATNTAPNGSTTSNLVSEDSSTGLHRIFQSTAYVTGTSYAISVFLKYAGRQFVAITHPAVAANSIAIFDIQNGTISLTQSGVTTSITAYPNGWYRCVVNGVSSITSSSSHIIQGSTTGGTLTGSYTGLNGAAFYIYGSQVEAGAFPTSYIPTTTASVVRSADICSITGANFTNLWNTSGGTFLFDGVLPSAPTLNNRLLLSSGGSRRWLYGNLAGQGGMSETLSAFDGATTPSYFTNVRLTTRFKIAISVEALACRASFNGSSVNSISHNGNLLNSVTLLALCEGGAGTITGVRYYRKNLANAKLQALTA